MGPMQRQVLRVLYAAADERPLTCEEIARVLTEVTGKEVRLGSVSGAISGMRKGRYFVAGHKHYTGDTRTDGVLEWPVSIMRWSITQRGVLALFGHDTTSLGSEPFPGLGALEPFRVRHAAKRNKASRRQRH